MNAPTRRAALRASAAAGLAGLIGATAAKAASASADADLIEACGRFCDLEAAIVALHATRKTIEAERRTEPDLDRLNAEQECALDAIEANVPPRTRAGIAAVARALLASWEKAPDGDPVMADTDDWLAVTLAEAVCAMADKGSA
ncbi:MAG TPA: hypothetical protein VHO91_10810 [Rhodopila sp.]|nr:hypothetical protein [Rhodopila sp.]